MEECFAKAKAYYAQLETGDGEKTDHVQGVIRFKLQRDFAAVKLKFPRSHLEICNDWEASKLYCQKEDTRTVGGQQWSSDEAYEAGLYDPLEGKELYLWQKELLDKIKNNPVNEDRLIYWYWEPTGATGKSAFARHLCIKNKKAIYVYGKTQDIMCLLALRAEELKEEGKNVTDMPNIIMYDSPRKGIVNYRGLEQIKNGIFMAGKYKSSEVKMNPPFIVVFANEPPATERFSRDRLKVYKIDEDKEAQVDETWDAPIVLLRRTDNEMWA